MGRFAFIDFQDGAGFRDISGLVKYDTLTITTRANSDNWHYAQNEATFDIIYDETMYPLLCALSKEAIVRIIDVDSFTLNTELWQALTTEDGWYLTTEGDNVVPVFYGRVSPTRSRTYNGVKNNTIFRCEAIDELSLLKVKAGDLIYRNFYIMNPNDKAHSIVHQLCYKAGLSDAQIDNTVSIMEQLNAFTPPSPDDLILDLLDALLFEYGYTLNMSTWGQIQPLRWMRSGEAPTDEFDESSIVKKVTIKDALKQYDGAEVLYYELAEAATLEGNSNMLLYQDSNLPYNNIGEFQGYPIPAGYRYPPKTNVIDETTGTYQRVYQDYDDKALKYWTNDAIVKRLDYNYKAFESDYSAILATWDHTLSWRGDTGIVLEGTPLYENRRAVVVFKNTTSDNTKRLYYFNIYGKVLYKSTERKAIVNNLGTDAAKLDSYASTFIFEKQYADRLAKYLAEQHKDNNTYYEFESEKAEVVGQLVNVKFDDGSAVGGVNVLGYIVQCTFDNRTELYTYKVKKYSNATLPPLTKQEVHEIPNVQANAGATNNAQVTGNVVATGGKYMGRYENAHPTNPSNGAWWTVYRSDDLEPIRGVWYNNNGTYERITASSAADLQAKFSEALTDVAWAEANGYGTAANYGIASLFQSLGVVTAFVDKLFTNRMTVSENGYIQSSNFVSGTSGFRIKANGEVEFSSGIFRDRVGVPTSFGSNPDWPSYKPAGIYPIVSSRNSEFKSGIIVAVKQSSHTTYQPTQIALFWQEMSRDYSRLNFQLMYNNVSDGTPMLGVSMGTYGNSDIFFDWVPSVNNTGYCTVLYLT